jgi:hypothetical protein
VKKPYPKTRAKNGSGHIDASGYKRVFGGKYKEHILIAEQAIGRKLVRGEVVHHIDKNRSNNRKDNLLVCDAAYHKLIHQRMDAMDACGNPNWRKCVFCKKYDDPKELYIFRTTVHHKSCKSTYDRIRHASRDN